MKATIIGAILGAVVAVSVGIPSFTISSDTQSEPPLFNMYCSDSSYFTGKCNVGPGTLLVIVVLAAVGAGIGYAISRRRSSG